MFFVETLGPALTQSMGLAMIRHVQKQASGRAVIPVDDLRAYVSDFLRRAGNATTPDQAIDFLARRGAIAAQSPDTVRIAA
ncbi:MAG: hypothetical protein AB7O98_11110 [Hyphomonadaceae bacterium]